MGLLIASSLVDIFSTLRHSSLTFWQNWFYTFLDYGCFVYVELRLVVN
jgi:hypothetical protein